MFGLFEKQIEQYAEGLVPTPEQGGAQMTKTKPRLYAVLTLIGAFAGSRSDASLRRVSH